MEEKERYEVISPSLNGYAYIHDFKTDNVLNTYDSCDLLNQQSKRLKEFEQENRQLKDQARKAYQEGLLQKQFDKDMEIQELKDKIEHIKQSQKQLAIDELTRFKDFIDHNIEIENDIGALKLQEFYGNQINQLKEME